MNRNETGTNPSNVASILASKSYAEPSVFTPANLLREARRQKGLACGEVPWICVLDPDGDIVGHLRETGRARPNPHWACYHTRLYDYEEGGVSYGIVGGVVGAPFAVLVAEELFASGCRFLISVTSAGQITPVGPPPYFVLIERALRDEGTSYHYKAPSPYSELRPELLEMLRGAFEKHSVPVAHGTAWTTDAPFRETAKEIERHRSAGVLAVEMEASALYAFAEATKNPVVCFAHVTNQMASIEGDFEKGTAQGSVDAFRVVSTTAERWLAWNEHDRDPNGLPGSSGGDVSGGSEL
ncbi:MAG: nucleoside phosphorylase [Actinomycetota bacterium]|nr:nucleoside phosphorylase [Actinomycetota bacterium]